jgi:hypothetical protein
MFSAPHTATARRLVLTYSLKYDGGSAVFTAGKTLTGATSHATATIVSTGSAASGTLVIHTISGVFQNDELLSDDGTVPGAAVADGVTSVVLDSYGVESKTSVASTLVGRFFRTAMTNPVTGAVTYSQDDLSFMYPPGLELAPEDTITGVSTGYAYTYVISSITTAYSLGALHHYTARIARQS